MKTIVEFWFKNKTQIQQKKFCKWIVASSKLWKTDCDRKSTKNRQISENFYFFKSKWFRNFEYSKLNFDKFEKFIFWWFLLSRLEFKTNSKKKKFAIVISLAIEKLIDEKSKNNQFSKIHISKKIMLNTSKFFVTKNLQFEFSTNSKIKKFLITTKKILKKRDEKFFSRSKFQKIDLQLKLHRFVNVENCDELVFWKIIKILTNKNSIFAAASLKLNIVFKILQKIDFFSIKIRSQVLQISKKQNDDNRVDEKNRTFRNSVAVDIVNILKWHIKNDIFCWKNKWYIFLNLLKKELLKQNHNDFYAKHFNYNKIFDLMKKKYFWIDISKNVKQYVEFCITCRKIKTVKHKLYKFLNFLFMFEDFRKN